MATHLQVTENQVTCCMWPDPDDFYPENRCDIANFSQLFAPTKNTVRVNCLDLSKYILQHLLQFVTGGW